MRLLLTLLSLLSIRLSTLAGAAMMLHANGLAIAGHRREYCSDSSQDELSDPESFRFGRFSSPESVKKALSKVRKRPFKRYHGKDGRKGWVSSTKLGGDWVLAESEQTALECTTRQVLQAYLSGHLQRQWNQNQVLDCKFKQKGGHEPHYQQDLVLRSQRVIRSHTGVMRYSQTIVIDQVGDNNYCVSVQLDPDQNTTERKPFDSLSVYVSLEQKGCDVRVYAAGVMQVNRKVVPNLVVFDASGIAGSMAGKGTLWLAAHFEKQSSRKLLKDSTRWSGRGCLSNTSAQRLEAKGLD